MKPIKAVLFDFDGTLVHSIDLLVQLFTDCLVEQGVTPTDPEEIRRMIGEPLDQIFRKLTNLVNVEKFSQSFHAREDALHTAEHIRLVKDTIPTLENLKSKGFKLGIVSTKQRELIEPFSREINILEFFDIIIGGYDVKKHKPHPEPIELACEKIAIDPKESMYVGDSLLDLTAAKEAGCIFVAVLTGTTTRKDFEKNQADHILESIGELNQLIKNYSC